jgi:hypothetical protein
MLRTLTGPCVVGHWSFRQYLDHLSNAPAVAVLEGVSLPALTD